MIWIRLALILGCIVGYFILSVPVLAFLRKARVPNHDWFAEVFVINTYDDLNVLHAIFWIWFLVSFFLCYIFSVFMKLAFMAVDGTNKLLGKIDEAHQEDLKEEEQKKENTPRTF